MFIEMAKSIEEQKKNLVYNIRVEVTDEKLRDFLIYKTVDALDQLLAVLKTEEQKLFSAQFSFEDGLRDRIEVVTKDNKRLRKKLFFVTYKLNQIADKIQEEAGYR